MLHCFPCLPILTADSGISRVAPHLQWRDRAGLAPAFPFKQITPKETALPPHKASARFYENPHLFLSLLNFNIHNHIYYSHVCL